VAVDIVEAARRGSEDAWRDLFDACYPRVYRFFRARVSSEEAAEDLASGVFLEAFRSIERFAWRERPFEAWLFGIARHQLTGHYRAESRLPQLDEAPAVSDSYLSIEIADVLGRLRPEHRQALELRYILGLTGEESAAAMGRSHNAFRQLLHRATQAFQREDSQGDLAPVIASEQRVTPWTPRREEGAP
jgi:RNA polymerase sigma-70 factor (ECF subfamily)